MDELDIATVDYNQHLKNLSDNIDAIELLREIYKSDDSVRELNQTLQSAFIHLTQAKRSFEQALSLIDRVQNGST